MGLVGVRESVAGGIVIKKRGGDRESLDKRVAEEYLLSLPKNGSSPS